MVTTAVVIPFRDRGRDPLRKANLDAVVKQWLENFDFVHVVDDGGAGDQQFNRSRAYNRGAELTNAEVLIFAESDMLVDGGQVAKAVELAAAQPGLVIPFTDYHYLSAPESALVRDGADPTHFHPEWSMRNGRSIGALNVMSRGTLEAVGGYDEKFEGSWWDDRAMRTAFDICTGVPTRFVDGPAHHLYHLPGWSGGHLTDEDKAATRRNKRRYNRYVTARTPAEIRVMTTEGSGRFMTPEVLEKVSRKFFEID